MGPFIRAVRICNAKEGTEEEEQWIQDRPLGTGTLECEDRRRTPPASRARKATWMPLILDPCLKILKIYVFFPDRDSFAQC